MKNKLQIKGLRNKLGWLLCLVAFLVCAQGAWAERPTKIYVTNSDDGQLNLRVYKNGGGECSSAPGPEMTKLHTGSATTWVLDVSDCSVEYDKCTVSKNGQYATTSDIPTDGRNCYSWPNKSWSTVTEYTIYFKRPSTWSNTPRIHMWNSNGDIANNYEMSSVPDQTDWYYLNVATSQTSTNLIFNNGGWGNGQSNQKSSWTISNACFTCAGSKKDITDEPCPSSCTVSFSTNPSSTAQTYSVGDVATVLTVEASSSDESAVSYQWYQNTSNSTSGGTEISGATNASYTPSTSEASTLYYYCIATGCNGETTATSTVSGKHTVNKSIVIKVKDEELFASSDPYIYAWCNPGSGNVKLTGDYPGTKMNTDSEHSGWHTYTVNVPYSKMSIILNNNSKQTEDITDITSNTCYNVSTTIVKDNRVKYTTVDCPIACTDPTLSATRYATRCKNTANSFTATVGITDIGTASCLSKFGVEYSTSSDFASSTKVEVTPTPTGTCSHDVTLNDLTANTKYYFRAYAQMTSGSYVYSTAAQNDYTKPTPVSSYEGVTSTSVTIKGKYETGGGNLSSVSELGLQVCPDTDFGNNKKYKNFTNVNSNTECQWTFTGDLALLPNTKYYYRTYIEYTDADGTTKCSNSDKSSTKYFTTNDVFSSVTLNDASVCAGATVTLVKSSTPSDGVTWTFSSSDTSVATVDEYGVVTGVAAGTAQITATAQKTGYDDKDAQCTVTVNALPSAPITHGTSVCIGTSATVTAEVVTPESTIKWYVDDKTSEVAETGPYYKVTEELNQELTVYAAAIKDGCASTRTAATATPIANMALTSIGASASSICIDGTSTITPTGLNLGGNGGSISYSSSDDTKATVESASENKGTVTGKSSSGDTPVRITATVSGGCKVQGSVDPTAYVDITVKPDASITSVSLDKSSVCVGTGAQASAVAVLGGGTGAWSSSDDTKATIDALGTITTNAAGTPTFTYTITGGCNAIPSETTSALTINAVPVITPASSNVTNFQVVDLSSTEDITTWTILDKVDNDSYFVGTTATTASFKGTVGGGDNKTFTIIGKTSNVCQGYANVTVTKDTETCP